MKVLIAGATGAIGGPLTRSLRDAGHAVFGLARSAESARTLDEAGAGAVIADATDAAAVRAAIRRVSVDAVVNELTSLPRRYTLRQANSRVRWTGECKDCVALRYGFFYGPGTWFCPDGDMGEQVRHRQVAVIGNGEGVWNWVHIDDAAAATVTLECAPGAYNIVGKDPSPQHLWLPAFARAIGAPEPPHVTEQQGMDSFGADSVYYATRLRAASNAKARRELSFDPRRLEWLAG
jgi:nucleoside-diphosphate-sugar epimerase